MSNNIEGKVVVITGTSSDRAYERVVNKDVRYRFVIDMASLKAAL